MKSPRFSAYLGKISALLGLLGLLSCGVVKEKQLDGGIDSPITLAGHPSKSVGYVLNAVLGAGYENGSLQSFAIAPGQPLSLLKSEAVPRLGTAMDVAQTGEFLIAGFSGSNSSVQLFSLDDDGLATSSARNTDIVYLGDRRIKSIKISKVTGEADWSVLISSNLKSGLSSTATKLDVFRYSPAQGFSKLFTAPDDFYTPSRESAFGAYTLAWNSPVIFESLGLAVAFPIATSGYQGTFPTAHQWLRGEKSSASEADLRIVSALAVDLKRLFSGVSADSSIGFIPLAFTQAGLSGDPQAASDAPKNTDLRFRVNYSSALALDASNGRCQLNSPLQALKQDSAIVSYGSKSSVLTFAGFAEAASQLRTKLDANEKQPVLGPVLESQPVSLAVEGEPDGVISQFQYVSTGDLCSVGWMRVEQGVNSFGAEKSAIQIVTSSEPSGNSKLQPVLKGTSAWSIVNGSSIFTGSFGANQVQQYEFDGSSITEGGRYP